MEPSKPQQKFFSTRELVERLISFLDTETTLSLAQSVVNEDTLRESLGSKAWSELIKRGSNGETGELQEEEEDEEELEEEYVSNLVKILKILKVMELEEPSKLILPLLDQICKMFPPGENTDLVQVVCPCNPEPHLISLDAFHLLEQVEGAFGTALQSIQSVRCFFLQDTFYRPLLSDISSRMSRMKESVTSISADWIWIDSKNTAMAFARITTLLQAQAQSLSASDSALTLYVPKAMGEEGWQVLAGALRDKPDTVKLTWAMVPRQRLAEAREEDIKGVWDALDVGFIVLQVPQVATVGKLYVKKDKFDWESGWTRLNQIFAMSEDELAAEMEEQWKEYGITDSESGEEEHGGGYGEGNVGEEGGDEGDQEEEPA